MRVTDVLELWKVFRIDLESHARFFELIRRVPEDLELWNVFRIGLESYG